MDVFERVKWLEAHLRYIAEHPLWMAGETAQRALDGPPKKLEDQQEHVAWVDKSIMQRFSDAGWHLVGEFQASVDAGTIRLEFTADHRMMVHPK